MTRLIEVLEAALANGRVVSVLDALLLGLGITATAAWALPLLQRAAARRTGRRRSWRRPLLLVLAVLALAHPSLAGAESPAEHVRAQIGRVVRVLEDPALQAPAATAQRRAEIRRLAAELFDFGEITKRALAQHWHGRTAAERQEIVALMTGLLERAYLSKIELYSGERISVVGETLDGEQATVRTRILTRQGTEIPVDYRLHRPGARWLVYDVVIEGVSLVANYRSQFAKIIQGQSYAELVRRLRARLAEPEPAEATIRRTSQR